MTKRSIILTLIAAALLVPSTDAAASVFKKEKEEKGSDGGYSGSETGSEEEADPLREADEGGRRFGLRKDVQSLPHVQGQDLYGLSKEYDGT